MLKYGIKKHKKEPIIWRLQRSSKHPHVQLTLNTIVLGCYAIAMALLLPTLSKITKDFLQEASSVGWKSINYSGFWVVTGFILTLGFYALFMGIIAEKSRKDLMKLLDGRRW